MRINKLTPNKYNFKDIHSHSVRKKIDNNIEINFEILKEKNYLQIYLQYYTPAQRRHYTIRLDQIISTKQEIQKMMLYRILERALEFWSFSYAGIKIYNKLPVEVKSAPSFDIFVYKFKTQFPKT